MKKLILLLATVTTILSCSKEVEPIDKQLSATIVYRDSTTLTGSTLFISQQGLAIWNEFSSNSGVSATATITQPPYIVEAGGAINGLTFIDQYENGILIDTKSSSVPFSSSFNIQLGKNYLFVFRNN